MNMKASSRSDTSVESDMMHKEPPFYPFIDRPPRLRSVDAYYVDHKDLESFLSFAFERLYTKEHEGASSVYLMLLRGEIPLMRLPWKIWKLLIFRDLLRAVVSPMIFTALGLFHSSHSKGAYSNIDVKVTYTLLSCTASLEYIGMLWTRTFVRNNGDLLVYGQAWPGQIGQYNLIAYLASKKKHWILMSIADFLGCEDYLDPLWCMKPCKTSWVLTTFVRRFIESWKENQGSEAATNRARAFNDNRGHWTIKEQGCGGSNILRESLRRPFDESVLLWHLATEFCYFDRMDTDNKRDDDGTPGTASFYYKFSRVISNYMTYLLFVNPEMLMTGSRPSLFKDAYKRLNGMLVDDDGEERIGPQEQLDDHRSKVNLDEIPLDDGDPTQDRWALAKKELAKKIIKKLGGAKGRGVADEAWALSEELMRLCNDDDDNDNMWTVIFGVWVEMLCFSASRCRGYLHAKSLGKGGEYLSYIWLLLRRTGMETLAEKMQRVPEQEDDNASGGGDKKRDEDGGSHCTTSAAPTTRITGDENV